MATIRLVPSTHAVSSSSYLSVSNASNMYHNTDNTTYATITNTYASTSSRYLYLRGFNFSDIPAGATIDSFSIKIKGYEQSLATSTSYAPRLANGSQSISYTTATTNFGTSTKTITIPTGSLTWDQIVNYGSNFAIMVYVRRSNKNTTGYFYCYGAEIEVNYSTGPIAVTGITLDKSTDDVDVGDITTLTATVLPSNATDKSVTWSSNNTSVATVSNGVVTGVSAGTATITVTTTDGGYTDSCIVTVNPVTMHTYVPASAFEAGKNYLIANGNTGTVLLLSGETGGSRRLIGVSATVSNNKITISSSVKSRVEFSCELYDSANSITTNLVNNGNYLFANNANGLVVRSNESTDRFWHYRDTKFWLFAGTDTDGYSHSTTGYKYYLTQTGNNFTDAHTETTSIEDLSIPAMYIFTEDTGSTEQLHLKVNGSWTPVSKVFKKINGSWVEQTDLSTVFDTNANYVKGN